MIHCFFEIYSPATPETILQDLKDRYDVSMAYVDIYPKGLVWLGSCM
jgi:hypothetical protein